MNKSLLVVIAAAVAAVGIWFSIQSRQAPEVVEPVIEAAPEPEVVEEEVVEEEFNCTQNWIRCCLAKAT